MVHGQALLAEILLAGFHHRLILRDNLSQSLSGGWKQPPSVVSKEGLPTATTYFKKHKISKGETVAQSLKERFDYGQTPDKTQGGELISSYECDYMTADAEFLLSKAKYKATTGREQRRDADVLCYQIRQSFKPGEITPEEANRVGYETAMRWTKGKYAFFVATHTDRQHIHNHIYYNSTSLDCSHKFRDFIGSARAVRRLSDRVCLENDLSVITNPKLHSKGRFLHYGAWLGTERQPSYKEQLRAAICNTLAKGPDSFDAFLRLMEKSGYAVKRGRGGAISFLVPGQQRATRLRSSTLRECFDPGDIRDVIAGKCPLPKLDAPGWVRFMSGGARCICYTDMYIIERSKHHDLHRSRENRYHHTVPTGQANPGIMRRIRRLRTDDLPLGKDILPSGSGRKTHLHRQRV